jgi:succinate dehydrogenase / fumarate reductase membrane anchor subunit
MAFLTDRKRAVGLGSARSGTEHHWNMTLSSYALLILTPLFLLAFGPMLGAGHEAVLARFAQPFPAIVTALMVVVGFTHFRHGIQMVIEDYSHGMTRHLLIVATTCLSYGAMAAGLFALVRLAL